MYETCDLPESEQDFPPSEAGEGEGVVEVLHISAGDAHERFKGKVCTRLTLSCTATHESCSKWLISDN